MKLCEYGCGQEATHQFKNGKWCCKKSQNSCEGNKDKTRIKIIGFKHDKPIGIEGITILCNYGCGNVALYKYKNGKYCCSESRNQCSNLRRMNKEAKHGNMATKYANKLLLNKELEFITSKDPGIYGRYVAQIFLEDGSDYSQVMIYEGFSKKESYGEEEEV